MKKPKHNVKGGKPVPKDQLALEYLNKLIREGSTYSHAEYLTVEAYSLSDTYKLRESYSTQSPPYPWSPVKDEMSRSFIADGNLYVYMINNETALHAYYCKVLKKLISVKEAFAILDSLNASFKERMSKLMKPCKKEDE